ncbi:MAG: thermonuclease family protein [Firmicutes bacterium]|nr:thermonuclease family protein [Bacillota bacterium]
MIKSFLGGKVRHVPMTAPIDPAHVQAATVRRVIDGDTIDVAIPEANNPRKSTIHRVRFIGADAPELRGPERKYGKKAKDFTKRYCRKNTRVWLVRIPGANNDGNATDAHRRLRRHVWIRQPQTTERAMRNGQLGAMLLQAGMARCVSDTRANANSDIFLSIQNEARRARRGIWKSRMFRNQ